MNSDQNRNLLWVIILLLITLILGLIFMIVFLLREPPDEAGSTTGTQAALTQTASSGGSAGAVSPAPTPIPEDPALSLGLPAWTDTFSSGANWAEFDNQCFTSEIRDGRFWMEAKGNVGIFCWELTWPQINRFYLETLARPEEACADGGAYGLFLRGPDTSRGYLFGLTCDDQYGMYTWAGDNGALVIQPQPSPDILTGEENRIGILADGNYFSIYVNGEFQTQVYDTTFPEGVRIGFFIRTPEEEMTRASFDNLTYWDLP
ncbi:MAG: hypothetical protein R3335_10280 [Anaerolineales bacterium]|nr:hypothetical protein [Anaerolineales bacterium]